MASPVAAAAGEDSTLLRLAWVGYQSVANDGGDDEDLACWPLLSVPPLALANEAALGLCDDPPLAALEPADLATADGLLDVVARCAQLQNGAPPKGKSAAASLRSGYASPGSPSKSPSGSPLGPMSPVESTSAFSLGRTQEAPKLLSVSSLGSSRAPTLPSAPLTVLDLTGAELRDAGFAALLRLCRRHLGAFACVARLALGFNQITAVSAE